ncbi:MAG: hypothetical protein PVF27_09850 [Gemmatimonadales bacterium]|jgi:hypothetical protein
MWRSWLLAALAVLFAAPLRAQTTLPEGWLAAEEFAAQYAVPDAPAFVLTEAAPSTILRPSSVRELGIALSDWIGADAQLTIPQAFAAEFAPALLVGGPSLTVSQYREAPWLYRLRVSVATRRPEGGTTPTTIALGVRATLLDDADLRLSDAYRARATQIASEINALREAVRERVGPMVSLDTLSRGGLTVAERDRLDSLMNALTADWEDVQNEHWNGRSLDVAFGLRSSGSALDGSDQQLDRVAGWLTYAAGMGTWGQLLLGATGGAERDPATGEMSGVASAAFRFYLGTNQYKLFAEADVGFGQDGSETWMFGAGGEALVPLGWITFSAGFERDELTGEARLATAFGVKVGVG